MQYKLTELKRSYNAWWAEIEQLGVKLQRWSDSMSQRLADWWRTVTYRWSSVSDLQRQLADFSRAAKQTLMGMCTILYCAVAN